MPDLKNLKVSHELHKQLRLTSIHNNMTIQKVVEMILKTYYDSRNKD